MRKITLPLGLGLALALCAPQLDAQDRRSALFVGGPGSCGSSGFNDPGLLSDGVTAASAQWSLFLDRDNSTLFLSLENTSPVLRHVPNPVLTRFYFNTPPQVTGMTLVSQSAERGTTPNFELRFDPDLEADPNPNSASIFGQFNVLMDNPAGLRGAIANEGADVLYEPDVVYGPVTFVFALEGELADVVADDFTTRYSVTPPGTKPALGVAKFKKGGLDLAYGWLNESTYCDSAAEALDLGEGHGVVMTAELPTMGSMCNMTVQGTMPNSIGWSFFSMPGSPSMFQGCDIFVSRPRWLFRTFVTNSEGAASFDMPVPAFFDSPECCGLSFVLQSIVFSDSGPVPVGGVSNGVLITIGG